MVQSPTTGYEYEVGTIVLSIHYVAPSSIIGVPGVGDVGSHIDQRDLFDAEMHDLGQVYPADVNLCFTYNRRVYHQAGSKFHNFRQRSINNSDLNYRILNLYTSSCQSKHHFITEIFHKSQFK